MDVLCTFLSIFLSFYPFFFCRQICNKEKKRKAFFFIFSFLSLLTHTNKHAIAVATWIDSRFIVCFCFFFGMQLLLIESYIIINSKHVLVIHDNSSRL
jgi:hypothetical protein